jgi:hypothetical protein
MGRESRLKIKKWSEIPHKKHTCCECGEKARPGTKLLRWSDHNDRGWVCAHCAAVWGYLDYCFHIDGTG